MELPENYSSTIETFELLRLPQLTDLFNAELTDCILDKENEFHYLYVLKNTNNNKLYFGITYNPRGRMEQHIRGSNNGKSHLYKAMFKYGAENFKMYLLYKSTNREHIEDAEIYHISKFNTITDGYNTAHGGGKGRYGSTLTEGQRNKKSESWTPEMKLLYRMRTLLQWDNEEFRRNQIEKQTNIWTPEMREEKRKQMIEFFKIDENRLLRSQQIRDGWTSEVRAKQSAIKKSHWTPEKCDTQRIKMLEKFDSEESRIAHSKLISDAWNDVMKKNVSIQKKTYFKTDDGIAAVAKAVATKKLKHELYMQTDEYKKELEERKIRKKLANDKHNALAKKKRELDKSNRPLLETSHTLLNS